MSQKMWLFRFADAPTEIAAVDRPYIRALLRIPESVNVNASYSSPYEKCVTKSSKSNFYTGYRKVA
jgi:hypothetical protein